MNCISDRTGAIRDAFPGSHVSHDPVARLHIAAVSLVIPGYAHQHPHLFTSHRAGESSPWEHIPRSDTSAAKPTSRATHL